MSLAGHRLCAPGSGVARIFACWAEVTEEQPDIHSVMLALFTGVMTVGDKLFSNSSGCKRCPVCEGKVTPPPPPPPLHPGPKPQQQRQRIGTEAER